MDFCEVAYIESVDSIITIRYTYFEGYLVILSKAEVSNAQITLMPVLFREQSKKFSKGLGKSKEVCIKVFPLLLNSSEECVKFVMYHEVGHIKVKDHRIPNYRDLRETYLDGGLVLPNELRADLYAANQIGAKASLAALEEILKTKRKSLAHLIRFSEDNKEKLEKLPVIKANHTEYTKGMKHSVMELEGRVHSMREVVLGREVEIS